MRPGKEAAEFRTSDGRLVVLRPLRTGDLDPLVRFANAMVKEKKANRDLGVVTFDRRLTRREERKFLDAIVVGVRKKEVVSLGAFVGGEVVGHCDVSRREPSDLRHTGVLGIVLAEGHRGVGIGERLMAEVLGEAARIGVWLVELRVFSINGPAIHLYEKMGFRRVGVVPNKMLRDGRGLDEVVMYADLRGSDKSTSTVRGRS